MRFLITPVLLSLAAMTCAAQPAKKLPPGLHEIAWQPDGTAVLDTTVAPGKFVEWCGALRAGERIEWRFDSAEPLDMNVHFHEGKNVTYPVKVEGRNGTGTLAVPGDQDYCWMWTAKSAAGVALKARLRRVP